MDCKPSGLEEKNVIRGIRPRSSDWKDRLGRVCRDVQSRRQVTARCCVYPDP